MTDVGLRKFLSSLGFSLTAPPAMRRWRTPKYWRCAYLPSDWNTTRQDLSPSRSPSPPREFVAFVEGKACPVGVVQNWLDTQAPVRIAQNSFTCRLVRLCLCVSRQRRDWTTDAGADREKYGIEARGSLIASRYHPTAPSSPTCRKRHAAHGKRWAASWDAVSRLSPCEYSRC